MKILFGTCLVITAVLSCAGCVPQAKGPVTYPVQGTVTLDGSPCPDVSIIFDPKDGVGGASQGQVVEGRFAFESEAGLKVVRISGTRQNGTDKEGIPIYVSLVPAKYNANSPLEADVQPGQKNEFTFDLKSK